MINKLTIQGFKVIDYVEIYPRKLNIIVGRNNTGKTSILEALYMILENHKVPPAYESSPSNLIDCKGERSLIKIQKDGSGEKSLSFPA